MAVKDFMTRKVVYISPDTTVAHAADLMREQGLHRLPVIENDKLVFNFSKLKISKLSEDYCDFEEDEEDSDDIILIGQAKTFLIVNSIEILLLRKSEKDLINFLKAIKIPSYKKYAKELFEFYQESLKIY